MKRIVINDYPCDNGDVIHEFKSAPHLEAAPAASKLSCKHDHVLIASANLAGVSAIASVIACLHTMALSRKENK